MAFTGTGISIGMGLGIGNLSALLLRSNGEVGPSFSANEMFMLSAITNKFNAESCGDAVGAFCVTWAFETSFEHCSIRRSAPYMLPPN